MEKKLSRRDFLKYGAGSALGMQTLASGLIVPATGFLLPQEAVAQEHTKDAFWTRPRRLTMFRTGVNEKLDITYFQNGRYNNDAYGRICWLLRDFKDGNQWAKIDIDLIDSLWALQEWGRYSESNPIWNVTSGFRTKRRNSTIEGAARNSMHVQARAVDGTMNGFSIRTLADRAKTLQVGGIGVYRTFIHLDSYNTRQWLG